MHFFTVTSFSPSVACGIERVYIMYIDGLGVGGCAMECIRMLHLPFGVGINRSVRISRNQHCRLCVAGEAACTL